MSRISSQTAGIAASLVVTPEVMLQRAETVQSCISQLKTDFKNLESTVKNTRGYWVGDAAEAHREFYTSKKDDINTIFARLSEDVMDLQKMSAIYSGAEQTVKEEAAALPADAIS